MSETPKMRKVRDNARQILDDQMDELERLAKAYPSAFRPHMATMATQTARQYERLAVFCCLKAGVGYFCYCGAVHDGPFYEVLPLVRAHHAETHRPGCVRWV